MTRQTSLGFKLHATRVWARALGGQYVALKDVPRYAGDDCIGLGSQHVR